MWQMCIWNHTKSLSYPLTSCLLIWICVFELSVCISSFLPSTASYRLSIITLSIHPFVWKQSFFFVYHILDECGLPINIGVNADRMSMHITAHTHIYIYTYVYIYIISIILSLSIYISTIMYIYSLTNTAIVLSLVPSIFRRKGQPES